MPIGLTRLNERRQRPNQNITFIKTLETPDAEVALDILERISAMVWPIMRDNHLGVMSLEEFPPNREFWGRNFNAGECIQLVLKSPMTGQWLPFSFICRVMIHELAHIKQMNHSRAFHAVRIGYTKELDSLTARGYTGDGFWSTGNTLSTDLTLPRQLEPDEMPENLCGGTYRRAKKTGNKRKLTYAEQKQKRKERLFGKGEGESLGADERARRALEKGKGKNKKAVAVKPRVANSQRGRDLRLEAALKRLESQNKQAKVEHDHEGPSNSVKDSDDEKDKLKEEDEEDGSATEDEYEEEHEANSVDVNGQHMVKVEEQGEDEGEWDELNDALRLSCATTAGETSGSAVTSGAIGPPAKQEEPGDDSATDDSQLAHEIAPSEKQTGHTNRSAASGPAATPTTSRAHERQRSGSPFDVKPSASRTLDPQGFECSVCTTINDPSHPLCATCANVLDTRRTPNWACKSQSCRDVGYKNPRDAGLCGLCGTRQS